MQLLQETQMKNKAGKTKTCSLWTDELTTLQEALESVMCDVIKKRLKRRIATRSEKGNQRLNIITAVERPILKL